MKFVKNAILKRNFQRRGCRLYRARNHTAEHPALFRIYRMQRRAVRVGDINTVHTVQVCQFFMLRQGYRRRIDGSGLVLLCHQDYLKRFTVVLMKQTQLYPGILRCRKYKNRFAFSPEYTGDQRARRSHFIKAFFHTGSSSSSPIGQWSDPIISVWITASFTVFINLSDTRK